MSTESFHKQTKKRPCDGDTEGGAHPCIETWRPKWNRYQVVNIRGNASDCISLSLIPGSFSDDRPTITPSCRGGASSPLPAGGRG